MSACSDPSETRLVPMTREQLCALGSLEDWLPMWMDDNDWRLPHIEALRRAGQNAPSDSVEAARAAIAMYERGIGSAPADSPAYLPVTEAALAPLGLRVGVHHDNGETT